MIIILRQKMDDIRWGIIDCGKSPGKGPAAAKTNWIMQNVCGASNH
jgi:hypothetical protein